MKVQNRVLKVVLQAQCIFGGRFLASLLALGGALVAGFVATSSVGAQKSGLPPSPEPPRVLWKWPLDAEPPLDAWRIAAAHVRTGPYANMHQAGLETLRQELFLGKRSWFPYGRSPFPPSHTRFLNFGRGAFVLGEVDDNDTLKWAALLGTQTPVPFFESSALRKEQGLTSVNAFEPFAAALGQTRSHVLAGEPSDVETSLLLAWSGGLQCLAESRGLSRPLQGFLCDTPFEPVALPSSPQKEAVAHVVHVCEAAGTRRYGALEVIRTPTAPNAVCFFQRTPSDERFEQGALESRLSCFDGSTKKVSFPSVADAQGLFPTSKPDSFLVYEGRYSPPKISLLKLNPRVAPLLEEIPSAKRALDAQNGFGGFASNERTGALARIPDGFESIYACQHHNVAGREPDPGEWQTEWYFVDSDVFEGRRALSPTDDRAFRVRVETSTSSTSQGPHDTLAIEPIPWDAVPLRAPGLDALPRLSCLLAPALDVKCALKVLRLGGQIALEVLTGAWDDTLSHEVRFGTWGLMVSALSDVEERLPQWALAKETAAMRAFFVMRLDSLHMQQSSHNEPSQEPWWRAQPRNASTSDQALNGLGVLRQRTLAPSARPQLLATLALPEDLWRRMETNAPPTVPPTAPPAPSPSPFPPPAETTTEDTAE